MLPKLSVSARGPTWSCVRLSPRSWRSDGCMVHPDAFTALVGRRAGALSADNARPWTDPCFAICPCQYGNLSANPFQRLLRAAETASDPCTNRDDSSCVPCISPTVRADAKMRRVVLLAPVSQHSIFSTVRSPRTPLGCVGCCNLTPGHRIPSVHSLASSSRPATNAVFNAIAMAHNSASRSGNHKL